MKETKKDRNGKFHYKLWAGRLSDEVIAEIKRRQLSEKSVNIIFEKLLGLRKQNAIE